ncbi:MAG: AbrB/MazE/SpoVT family DNA-binding domain-containing protein [Burkholderiales bacterium]|nr:AbrB/MazE/SpoVT family DNA-binding domain-containing protein [Burkholderiales bacterium]
MQPTLNANGQMSLPSAVRTQLGLKAGVSAYLTRKEPGR